MRRSS